MLLILRINPDTLILQSSTPRHIMSICIFDFNKDSVEVLCPLEGGMHQHCTLFLLGETSYCGVIVGADKRNGCIYVGVNIAGGVCGEIVVLKEVVCGVEQVVLD